jgi:ketosteroid isomerase-like protein
MTFLDHPNAIVKQQFVAAVFAGDFDTIRRLAHADFELHEGSGMPFAGVYRGAAGFIEFLGVFAAAFDIKRLEEACAYASDDPDRMAFQFELEAILPSSGAAFSSSLVETWQFRDGKVAKITAHYFNSPFRP